MLHVHIICMRLEHEDDYIIEMCYMYMLYLYVYVIFLCYMYIVFIEIRQGADHEDHIMEMVDRDSKAYIIYHIYLSHIRFIIYNI